MYQFPAKAKKIIFVLLVAICGTLSLQWFYGHISYNRTDSIQETFFWLEDPVNFKTRDFVLFWITDPRVFNGERSLFVKKISCNPGDTLSHRKGILNYSFYCNEKLISTVSEWQLAHYQLQLFNWDGVIPKDHYFVVGDIPDSYDSRFFGFVQRKDIYAKSTLAF